MIADLIMLALGWASGVATALLVLHAPVEPPQLVDPSLLPANLDAPPPPPAKIIKLVASPYAPKRATSRRPKEEPWTGG